MANFAIMGFGTVGSGAAEVLRMNADSITAKLGEPLKLKYILDVRDLSATPYAGVAVKDFSVLENDPDLDVVVESIGGAKVALDFTRRALMAGKHVVTSNKELVASHGKELLSIAREKNVNYLFEASVGGGIPVLRPLFQCLAGNQIEEIVGILNGTTNYILTRMVKGGIPFDEALKEAQAKGYAEQNPAADVEVRQSAGAAKPPRRYQGMASSSSPARSALSLQPSSRRLVRCCSASMTSPMTAEAVGKSPAPRP